MATRKKVEKDNKGVIAACLAGLALFAGALSHWKSIEEFFGSKVSPPSPSLGWLMVQSQGQFHCVAPEEFRFDLGDKRSVSLLKNACASSLVEKGKTSTISGESAKDARLLLVRNSVGKRIDRLEFIDSGGSIVDRFSALDKDETVAVCISYDGKSGNPGYAREISQVRMQIQGDAFETKISVPPLPNAAETRGIGSAGCGDVAYGYPPIEPLQK